MDSQQKYVGSELKSCHLVLNVVAGERFLEMGQLSLGTQVSDQIIQRKAATPEC